MQRIHDRGGWPDAGPIDRAEHDYTMWEKQTDALVVLSIRKNMITMDELRRAMEGIGPATYEALEYYERWIVGFEELMIEKGVLTAEEVEQRVAALDG